MKIKTEVTLSDEFASSDDARDFLETQLYSTEGAKRIRDGFRVKWASMDFGYGEDDEGLLWNASVTFAKEEEVD